MNQQEPVTLKGEKKTLAAPPPPTLPPCTPPVCSYVLTICWPELQSISAVTLRELHLRPLMCKRAKKDGTQANKIWIKLFDRE